MDISKGTFLWELYRLGWKDADAEKAWKNPGLRKKALQKINEARLTDLYAVGDYLAKKTYRSSKPK